MILLSHDTSLMIRPSIRKFVLLFFFLPTSLPSVRLSILASFLPFSVHYLSFLPNYLLSLIRSCLPSLHLSVLFSFLHSFFLSFLLSFPHLFLLFSHCLVGSDLTSQSLVDLRTISSDRFGLSCAHSSFHSEYA